VLARDDFAFAFERVPSDGFALIGQPLEPGHPLICDFLCFFWRKALVPVVPAKQQHVSILILCVHISFLIVKVDCFCRFQNYDERVTEFRTIISRWDQSAKFQMGSPRYPGTQRNSPSAARPFLPCRFYHQVSRSFWRTR